MSEPKYDVEVQLSDMDGNAGSIMGRVTDALKKAGAPNKEVNQFRLECMSGNYEELIQTCMKWVHVS